LASTEVLYTSPVELAIDTIVPDLFGRLRARGIRRVVIDAVSDLERAARDPVRYRDFLYALTQFFALENVTSLFTLETRGPIQLGETGFQEILNLSDNTLSLKLDLGTDLERGIRIMKTRGSAHDGRAHRLRIGAEGVSVDPAVAP
jgi:circadian clock protein KaiC